MTRKDSSTALQHLARGGVLRRPWLLLFMATLITIFSVASFQADVDLDLSMVATGAPVASQLAVGTFVHGVGKKGYVGPKGSLSIYSADDFSVIERLSKNTRAVNSVEGDLLVVGPKQVSIFKAFGEAGDILNSPNVVIPLANSGVVPLLVGRQRSKVRLIGTASEEPEKLISAKKAFGGWSRELIGTLPDSNGPDALALWGGERSGVVWSDTSAGVASLHIHLDKTPDLPALKSSHRLRDDERLSAITTVHLDGHDSIVAVCLTDVGAELVAWSVARVDGRLGPGASLRLTRGTEKSVDWSGDGCLITRGRGIERAPTLLLASDSRTHHFDVSSRRGALEFTAVDGAQLGFQPQFVSRLIFQILSGLAVLALLASAAVIHRRSVMDGLLIKGAPYLKRALASGVDFFLGYLVSILGFVVFGASTLIGSQLQRSLDGEAASGIGGFEEIELSQGGWVFLAALYILNVVGGAWMESRLGWTPGKYLLRLRVVSDSGLSGISFGRAIARRLILFVDLSFFAIVLMFLNPRRQRLGDFAASAIVVDRDGGIDLTFTREVDPS